MDKYPDSAAVQADHRNTYLLRLIIAAAAFAVFCLLHYLYAEEMLGDFDETIGEAVRSLRAPALDPFLKNITLLGNWQCLVGIGIVILVMNLTRWRKADCYYAIIVALINLGLYQILKHTIKRPRPDSLLWLIEEHGYSLPSGHSMNSIFCYGIMLYLIWRNTDDKKIRTFMTVLLCLIPLLVAFSRICCGVHYPSDVLAGLCMGLGMLMVMTVLIDEIILRQTISGRRKR